jgi:hypothetical protein
MVPKLCPEPTNRSAGSVQYGEVPVTVEMQNTGDAESRAEVVAAIEHVLGDRPGQWRVSILGSHANDHWEMRVEGPKGFERSYTLVGDAGEHEPGAIRHVLRKLLPADARR